MKYPPKMPQKKYSTTLDEQLEELKTDVLAVRFAAARARQSSDRYRPVYHYVNPEGPSNDPNGFCKWQDRYHLFYQQYPAEDKRQHWGHAYSDDLVYWHDLPIAIYPGIEERVYSGSSLVEDDRVLACYHGTSAGTMIAESSDPLLLNWDKIPGCPVIPETLDGVRGIGDPYCLGDPCLWKGKKGYYSLSGSFQGKLLVDCVPLPQLFFSEDLRNWTYVGPFLENDVFTTAGEDCAVPYFWPIGDKHILVFGSHQRGSQYLLGDWDEEGGGKFRPFAHDRFCFGPVNNGGTNAPTAIPDGNGGVLLMHMLSHGLDTGEWNGMMSLPSRLSLGPDNTVLNEPVEALEKLRGDHQHIGETALPANTDVPIEGVRSNTVEIIARIDPKDAREVCIEVLRSPGGEETTSIRYLQNGGGVKTKGPESWHDVIVVDTCRSSLHPEVLPRPPESANFKLAAGEVLEMRIYIDTSILEVFVNNRRYLTVRVHPDRDDSRGVRMRAQGKDAVLLSLDAWRMKNIYTEEE
jgi:beta-fructofuranosidase